MALTQYTADTDIIETLGTNPEDRPTLTDNSFKAKFDENAANIKTFLNAMIAELASTANGKGASQIGIEDSAGRYTATQIEAALAEIAGSGRTTETVKGLADLISTHTGETISKVQSVTRDVSLTGTQTITLPFKAKAIFINASINFSTSHSEGICDETLTQGCVANLPSNTKYTVTSAISIYTTSNDNNATGVVANITDVGFDIIWSKSGVPTGTAILQILALRH